MFIEMFDDMAIKINLSATNKYNIAGHNGEKVPTYAQVLSWLWENKEFNMPFHYFLACFDAK